MKTLDDILILSNAGLFSNANAQWKAAKRVHDVAA